MAINNPLIPGDPYSYDLKWIIKKLKEHGNILSTLDERIAAAVQQQLSQSSPVYYKTAADLIASDALTPSLAYIEGFYEVGDLGANLYYVTSDYNDVLNADFFLTLTGANRWAIPIITTPFVTPEMFGAKGDGVEDDTEALQKAIKYPHAVLNKAYRVTETLTCSSNTKISGVGSIKDEVPEGTITFEFPALFLIDTKENVEISGLTIYGPGSLTDNTIVNHVVFKTVNSKNVELHHMRLFDIAAAYCFRFDATDGIDVHHNVVDRYTFVGVGMFSGCENANISDNELYELTGTHSYNYAITLSAHEGQMITSKHVICSRNTIVCTSPVWEAIDAHGGENLIITDNHITNAMNGIAVLDNLDDLNNPWTLNDVVITGNIIELGTNTAFGRVANNSCIVANGNNIVIQNNVLKNAGYICAGQNSSGAVFVAGNNIDVANNVINNVNGHVFQHKWGTNVCIHDNQVINWRWTPSGSLAWAIFYWQSETANIPHAGDTYVERNIIHDAPTDARLARAFANLGVNGGICYVKDNVVPAAANLLSQPANIVCTPYTNFPGRVGHVGDVIMKSNPTAGTALGWICTVDYVNGAGGTWTPLPSL